MKPRILFIYPPHSRNTEPPLGIALLSAFLKSFGIPSICLDLNSSISPLTALSMEDQGNHRSHRASLHIDSAVQQLQNKELYLHYKRYRTAIEYYAEAFRSVSTGQHWKITPGDFTDKRYPDFGIDTVKSQLNHPDHSPYTRFFKPLVTETVHRFNPSHIGISMAFRSQFLPGLALAGALRNDFPDINQIIGGSLIQSLPAPTCEYINDSVAQVVSGIGEEALRHLCNLPGAADQSWATPDFSDFEFAGYFAPVSVLPIQSSRGCYWQKCAFCAEVHQPFCIDPPEKFIKRLNSLADQYCPCIFHLTDNAIPLPTLKKIADCGSPAPWYGFVRATRELTNLDFVKALASSGCKMLQLGLETRSKYLLKRMNKGIDPEHFSIILDNLKKAGIKSYVYMLFGFPGETSDDRQQTLEFLEKNPADFLNASIFRLPPGSDIARHPERFGLTDFQPADTKSIYCRNETAASNMPDLRKWMSRVFLRHPSVKMMVSNTPDFYKSNHAVFF